MSFSRSGNAFVGAMSLAVATLAPAAQAEQFAINVGDRVLQLCVPVGEHGRVSLGVGLKRIIPDGIGCEFDVQMNSGKGASSTPLPLTPAGKALTLNALNLTDKEMAKTIRAACLADGALVDTGDSGATVGACPGLPLVDMPPKSCPADPSGRVIDVNV